MIGKILKQLTDIKIDAISGLDASFLYIESPTSPMHVGSISVIEGSLEFDTFRETVRKRIHMIPRLRQRLMYVPMSVDYPYWVDDPNFDLDMHLHRIALPKPGSWKELRETASRIFSQHLDRSRPLWSFTFLEGLDNIPQVPKGSVAIIAKIHHVAIDGMAGAGMLSIMYDFTPEVKEMPEPKPFRPKPLPNELSMMLKSAVTFAKKPLKLPGILTEAAKATIKTGMVTRVQKLDPPTAPFTSPPSPLNGIISGRRKWNTAILDLQRVKAIKNIMGTTLNDVILAFCAGALRRYLLEKNELPAKPLVAMVPISTRDKKDESTHGNQLSSMLVQLATNIEDPVLRLEKIHENTITSKTYQGAMGAKTLASMAEIVPFGVANQAARLYSRYNLAKMHNPVFNVTITNVPGPQFPLYISGHKLLSIMGMAPIIDGMGLIITVLSYNGHITISPTSDVKTMPDIDIFSRYIREAANELEAEVLKIKKKEDRKKNPELQPARSNALFELIREHLKSHPDMAKNMKGVYHFHINGTTLVDWKLDFSKKKPSVRKSGASNPDLYLEISDEHMIRLAKGELDMQTIMLQGRIKTEGDESLIKPLGKFLQKIPPLKDQ